MVRYPGNIVMVESTSLNEEKDFEDNYAKFFTDFHEGLSAEEVARKKGVPVAIVDIKLKKACRKGKLAVANRIEGIKYYKNLLITV